MNILTNDFSQAPDLDEAAKALGLLRAWAAKASSEEIDTLDPALAGLLPGGAETYPAFSRSYPGDFRAGPAYRETLPDLQNGPESLIKGARTAIQHVGISNFRLPVRIGMRDGSVRDVEARITGTVGLDAEKKGINMSRIMRSFYVHAREVFGADVIERALDDYKRDLESSEARILMKFALPLERESLRSGLTGWQYYEAAIEIVEAGGVRTRILHLDYVYSSTCPCSLELSEHARRTRGQLATPHSQRSVARISVVAEDDIAIEDLIDHARAAVPTETQTMVKREDEQAFAELNAANPIFVEDAARLFAERLLADVRIGDFRIAASHQESLHSHDAVSVLTEGDTFAATGIEPGLFGTLVHPG